MKLKNYIIFLQIALLAPLFASGQDINVIQPQNLAGLTVFDSTSIYIENNSLAVHGILTTVLEKQTKNSSKETTKEKAAEKKQRKIAQNFKKAVKAIAKNKSKEFIFPANGGSPLQNSFFAKATVGICTTTNTNYKYNVSIESNLIDSNNSLSIDYTTAKSSISIIENNLGTSSFSYYHSSRPPPFI